MTLVNPDITNQVIDAARRAGAIAQGDAGRSGQASELVDGRKDQRRFRNDDEQRSRSN